MWRKTDSPLRLALSGNPPPRDGEELFRSAQRLVGTRFRLHGRDPATGLDCIGLVIAAYESAHLPLDVVPDDYRMRGRSLDEFRAGFARLGFAERRGVLQPADIALINCGHGQYHVALIGAESHVHAHAGLRRVVETPDMPDGVVAAYHFLT